MFMSDHLCLNPHACNIKNSDKKGRGVYASCKIPKNSIVERSPVLLFTKDEYEAHGQYTLIDHYTFKWPDGRMALALGLGSLFNHDDRPNVSYTLEPTTATICYVAARDIEPDEELCIFYGHKLWFDPAEPRTSTQAPHTPEVGDGWGGLSMLGEHTNAGPSEPFLDSDPEDILTEDQLPFIRYKLPPEEEEPGSIRTVQAWAVDIPDPRTITRMLKWLKQSGLDTPELGHLRRIRKQNDIMSMLLATSPSPPELPEDVELSQPYIASVPASPALTLVSLELKSALWPTVYAPQRKHEAEDWSRAKARWAWDAMRITADAAVTAQERGEYPIAAHIPISHEGADINTLAAPFTAADTRKSTGHPLRHAVLNVIRMLADSRSSTDAPKDSSVSTSSSENMRNGANYLLTSLTLFTTHEPCIMCSMALIHSRVKEIFYLYPMEQTGGCGGSACLSTSKGVNHRFGICRWRLPDAFANGDLQLDATLDA